MLRLLRDFFSQIVIGKAIVLQGCLREPWRIVAYLKIVLHHLLSGIDNVRRPRIDGKRTESLNKVLVVLRTSDAVMNCNAGRDMDAFGIATKQDVIRHGGITLFAAARAFVEKFGRETLEIVLVSDRLSESGRTLYHEAANQNGVSFSERASESGNRATFQSQVDVASLADDDTLVFFLEDDYELKPETLVLAFELFRDTCIIGFNPHFHPWTIDRSTRVRLYHHAGRLFVSVPTTCCTFFTTARHLRRHLKDLRRYVGFEIATVNELWRDGTCLAPCGFSLAEHLHRSELSYVDTRRGTS